MTDLAFHRQDRFGNDPMESEDKVHTPAEWRDIYKDAINIVSQNLKESGSAWNLISPVIAHGSSRKIAQIKEIRAQTGLNLKDAKFVCDYAFDAFNRDELPELVNVPNHEVERLREKNKSLEITIQNLQSANWDLRDKNTDLRNKVEQLEADVEDAPIAFTQIELWASAVLEVIPTGHADPVTEAKLTVIEEMIRKVREIASTHRH